MEKGKILTVLFAVFILVALFLASPRGKKFLEESKLKDKLSFIGNFFKSLSGRLSSVKHTKSEKIDMKLNSVNKLYLDKQEFSLSNSQIFISLKPDSADLNGMSLSFKDQVQISSYSFNGNLAYNQDKIVLQGKVNDVCIDNLCFNKTDISFNLVGKAEKYKITNAKKSLLAFNEITGTLSWSGLKTPATLEKDKLELYDFEGSIEEKNSLVYFEGKVAYMKLNNVPIGIST
ncbi:MAG: hypothetical protein QXO84_01580 [Candidatus Aenigmatarchaeota archaeon]